MEVQRIISSIFPVNSAKKNKKPRKFSLEMIPVNNPVRNPQAALVNATAAAVVLS